MSPFQVGLIVLVCVFSGALLGMILGATLPEHHMSPDSKDVVKLGMGLIATMAALVLGLLIASAKGTYESQNQQLKQIAANVVLLDRVLAHYGPETKDARDLLRRSVEIRLDATWPEDRSRATRLDLPETTIALEGLQDKVRDLTPRNDAQRWLQSRALQVSGDVAETRWLLFGVAGPSVPMPFLIVLVFWITTIFASFGLVAPRNAMVVGVLLVCALSIGGAVYLILDMDRPFVGWMKISRAPLDYALSQLGK